jgi:hypothetical protein
VCLERVQVTEQDRGACLVVDDLEPYAVRASSAVGLGPCEYPGRLLLVAAPGKLLGERGIGQAPLQRQRRRSEFGVQETGAYCKARLQ